jgi:surfeit locus 1 family protein
MDYRPMKLPFADRRFWLVLVAAVLSASLTASLGFWQLRRADQKETLQREMDARLGLPPISNGDLREQPDVLAVLHRAAVLRGTWVADATVFLDNRQMNSRQGFYVVTPLKLENDGRLLWVQRGWVPRDFLNRTHVPQVPTPSGLLEVPGRMATAPSKIYELGASEPGVIRQNLDIGWVGSVHRSDVILGSLVQRAPVPSSPDDGLERNWPPVAVDVYKHYGYAFQWFGLCALIVVLYVWFQIISPWRQQRVTSS